MTCLFLVSLGLAPPLLAEESAGWRGDSGGAVGAAPAGQTGAPAATFPAAPSKVDEPEEPDFLFIAGGPYTQKKTSPQFIIPSAWSRRTSTVGGTQSRHSEFSTLFRTEYGLTDRWEMDVIFSASGEQAYQGQQRLVSTFALADSVVGLRYRILRESSAPITLTMGPQIIIPTGSFASGTGNSAAGVAWDLAAAKDWGGPVFVYASANYAYFPSVNPGVANGPQHFPLHNVSGATALGFRPLEKDSGPNHHDIHMFLEYGVSRQEGLDIGTTVQKAATTVSLFAPGVRYGFLTARSKLIEIGVSFPIGLSQATPRGGIIVQFQFENLILYKGN
jgi:hypothetical protein